MNCNNCGTPNPEEARFCCVCGTELIIKGEVCTACGQVSPPGSSFCNKCGRPLAASCAKCGHINIAGACFCAQCGRPLAASCAKCGHINIAGACFCAQCGNRLNEDAPPIEQVVAAHPECTANIDTSSIQVPQLQDTILFGRYPQGYQGQSQPIKWKLLRNENGKMWLVSEYGLDCRKYHNKMMIWFYINWSECSLRTWLNGEFLQTAFSAQEQERLLEVTLSTPKGPWYKDRICPDTKDRVFLLSYPEAANFFASDSERCCKPTPYALSQGASVDKDGPYFGNGWWWLRSYGVDGTAAACVQSAGNYGSRNIPKKGLVRPAICLASD